MKRKIIAAISAALVVALTVGLIGYATSPRPGSQDDPLVTLSYLNEVITKQVTDQLRTELTAKLAELEPPAGDATTGGATNVQSASDGYRVVTLSAGSRITFELGAEFILRFGVASCVAASAPGFIDVTNATTINDGAILSRNCLYVVSIEGRGLRTADGATIVVRGGYTIS